ncbi:DUF202 domain-containing protein [Streptomyces sp. NBC_01498]|uniref:DUF202 domain-containing protein n=1 Tax=Streptomyces sp. NBC_01498 TaxID=2975870 RepID=UPI002E7BEA2B|nr:DUF202 domain-containing protein [Streptomyces sp. NBC_01498]WTL27662.1 DUF202 domain-containing protein [Streptomyces sp. NBC_01498]
MAPRPSDEDARDPGLQPERTRLAWRRTTLTYTVVAVLAGRQVVRGGVTATGVVAAVLSGLVWLAFLWVAHRRIGALGASRPGPLGVRAGAAAALCVLGLVAFGLTVL